MARARYDWEVLKKEYLLGDYKSEQEFAREKQLPESCVKILRKR